jgi:hypothetical protein
VLLHLGVAAPAPGVGERQEGGLLVRSSGYELRTTKRKGDGVFATRPFQVGETVVVGTIARRLSSNTRNASQVSLNEFVLLGGLGSKVNHSCDPNCGVRVNESGAYDLIALRDFATAEEITFDYAMRNYSVEHFPIRCLCGSQICRGSITGWKDLPLARKEAYRGFVAPYLLELDRKISRKDT